MAILHDKIPCPKCGKEVTVQSEFPLGKYTNVVYSCGHLVMNLKPLEERVEISEIDLNSINSLSSSKEVQTEINKDVSPFERIYTKEYDSLPLEQFETDGAAIDTTPEDLSFYSVDLDKKAYPFQIEGIKFAEKSSLKVLIADAMGLGKTIQALGIIKRNPKVWLIIVKGSTTFQWAKEFSTWVSPLPFDIMPITDRAHIIPGFKTYIISMDFLSRKGVREKLNECNIEGIILDEVQNFKDSSSKRTINLIKLIQDNQIRYRIALSGTPIKNRADEYFTILNLLDPGRFSSITSFRRNWLIQNEKGVYTRLNPVSLDYFKTVTSKYIIRREKHEVLKNLPPLTRDWKIVEIDGPIAKSSYNQTLDLFKNFLQTAERVSSNDILGWLAKLRAITGYAKIPHAIDFIQEFLDTTDESLAVGIHHHSVRDGLHNAFESRGISNFTLSGSDDSYKKNLIQSRFNAGEKRLIILNSLAGGIGLNLQTCANALILERQWNNADEEQFEARFHRDGQKNAVMATYMIAKGTIDEWFHDLVHQKSHILSESGFGIGRDETQEISFLKDFAEKVISERLR